MTDDADLPVPWANVRITPKERAPEPLSGEVWVAGMRVSDRSTAGLLFLLNGALERERRLKEQLHRERNLIGALTTYCYDHRPDVPASAIPKAAPTARAYKQRVARATERGLRLEDGSSPWRQPVRQSPGVLPDSLVDGLEDFALTLWRSQP